MPTLTGFSDYLHGIRDLSSEQCERFTSCALADLCGFIRRWHDVRFTKPFDPAYSAEYYRDCRSRLHGNAACQRETGEEAFGLYSQTLRHLADYLAEERRRAGLGRTQGMRRRRQPPPAPIWEPPTLTEGELSEMHAVRHERNQEARRLCLTHYRARHGGQVVCECCGFDFGAAYGALGEDFMEVHHLSPISQQPGAHAICPETDLVPLCANCHAMIHRLMGREHLEGWDSLKRLRTLVQGGRHEQ